jgi:putative tryptophan/tyrosine transport system substrate-binding protein
MRRREFITLVSGVAATWPLAVRAHQPATPVVGFLSSTSAATYGPVVIAFREGLSETGYLEGQNLNIEYRWAGDRYDRLPVGFRFWRSSSFSRPTSRSRRSMRSSV